LTGENKENIQVKWNKLQRFYVKVLKRGFDIFFGVLFFIVLTPILLVTIFAVKIDSRGGAFFKQQRLGINGKPFWMYKFRSMVIGAEKTGTGVYSYKGDARVTKVGRFIRRTSIDEMPQIINIIKGDMSFIGPRPTLTYHPWEYDAYSDFQKQRFLVRPGITGLAQTKGRKAIDWSKRIVYDVQYISEISMINDIKLFLCTIGRVLKAEENVNVSKTAK